LLPPMLTATTTRARSFLWRMKDPEIYTLPFSEPALHDSRYVFIFRVRAFSILMWYDSSKTPPTDAAIVDSPSHIFICSTWPLSISSSTAA
jgi:hypothetical protein